MPADIRRRGQQPEIERPRRVVRWPGLPPRRRRREVSTARMPTSTSSPAGVSARPATHGPAHGAGEFRVRAAQCGSSRRCAMPADSRHARRGRRRSTAASRAARPIAGLAPSASAPSAMPSGNRRRGEANAHVSRPDVDTITAAARRTGRTSASEPNAERAVRFAPRQAPSTVRHPSSRLTARDRRRCGRHPAADSRRRRRGRGTGLAARIAGWFSAMAAMKLSAFDTQPKIAPCALIISRPTRWNSGK